MYTEKNHPAMKTVVETFVIEETQELIYDNEKLDKWNKYVEELGLTGQTKIITPTKSPIPFMHMKNSLVAVFRQLCPRSVDVEAYDITPIPVEILDLISLSKRENYFSHVQIWYDDKSPDPACIGIKSDYYCYDKNYHQIDGLRNLTRKDAEAAKKTNPLVYNFSESNANYYLIGKWADVKHSFEELKEMATKRFISEKGNEYAKAIKEAQRGLDDLQTEAFDKFN